jgi:hypothetical protein
MRLVRLAGGLLLGAVVLQPMTANAQNAAVPQPVLAAQQTSVQGQPENTGQDFVRPLNMFQLRYEYETAPGKPEATQSHDIACDRADRALR